ncbi:MAG: DUF1638 domain-containing protein [Deltaproteobacteria bacterium]|nr:DUF1638 domain-containing protein [Deltaproteobacteria bacterium]
MENQSFKDTAIVACGTMSPEINHLAEEGFLDTQHIIYTTPGLHQDIPELEKQLIQFIEKAKAVTTKGVIVVYGGKYCYVNPDNPTRLMQTIIKEQGLNVARVEATHCMGMLASDEEMENIKNELAGGEPVWFMTPGWVKYRKQVFKGWDKGIANENFPRHTGGAIILDGIGYLDKYMEANPEEFLDYCDWMGIPMQAYPISLDRFKGLLIDQLKVLNTRQ